MRTLPAQAIRAALPTGNHVAEDIGRDSQYTHSHVQEVWLQRVHTSSCIPTPQIYVREDAYT